MPSEIDVTTRKTITFPVELAEKIDKIAEHEHRSFSAQIISLLEYKIPSSEFPRQFYIREQPDENAITLVEYFYRKLFRND